MKKKLAVYWCRRDLRLHDNPALSAALSHAHKEQSAFLPLFILEDYMQGANPKYQFGLPNRLFLTKALPLFGAQFPQFALVQSKTVPFFKTLSDTYELSIFVNEDVHEDFYSQIKKIRDARIEIKLYKDMLTIAKDTVSGSGSRYSIFTPFKNAVWHEFVHAVPLKKAQVTGALYLSKTEVAKLPHYMPHTEKALRAFFSTKRLCLIGEHTYDIDALVPDTLHTDTWYYTESEALDRFRYYIKNHLLEYRQLRDSLEQDRTSHMSLGLAWGLVSSRMLVTLITKHVGEIPRPDSIAPNLQGPIHFISELIWREFYKYLYYHNPKLLHQEFQTKFQGTISWADAKTSHERFTAWIKGQTGYPIVDAAMHQLAQTGWMHNRARMIVASVLTKNLGVDWRFGQEYFRAMLVDLDEASNNGGWQWGASTGADPKPIRIFNPYLQAENYDPNSVYQKKYLSEAYLANPPLPLVPHSEARTEALARYGLSGDKKGKVREY